MSSPAFRVLERYPRLTILHHREADGTLWGTSGRAVLARRDGRWQTIARLPFAMPRDLFSFARPLARAARSDKCNVIVNSAGLALAIRAGALWVAANVDRTLPTERGLLPGNGAMVAALKAATEAEPQVAGKPAPALMRDALARSTFRTPLVVGDRLDTDIAAANAAGLPSLMVLTGVSSARDAVGAIAEERPIYLGHDLRALNVAAGRLAIGAQPQWDVKVDGTTVTVAAGQPEDEAADGLSVVRALASAVWDAELAGSAFTVAAADDTADAALQRWSLLGAWPIG